MVHFEQTWRWFGPTDRITLTQIKQTGATGIVTALHQIPVGDVWRESDIMARKAQIEKHGLRWSVVESVPVSEDIKRRIGNYQQHIDNYKQTLINLHRCGIRTVCYNFMPVLDWSRTDLSHQNPDGSYTLKYEFHKFAAFDLFILGRQGAESEYPPNVLDRAQRWYDQLDEPAREQLKATILLGLPGSLQAYTLDEFREILTSYRDIDKYQLREHLRLFLHEVVPVAETHNIQLAIHPDDPPWPLLGLPRVVSTSEDIEFITRSVPSPANGITLCTGSLGAGHFNDLTDLAEQFAPRVHFAHLRNVSRTRSLDFWESNFFDGDVDLVAVTTILLKEMIRRKKEGSPNWQIPMRPDHGSQMLKDIGQDNYPGYGLYGRMRNLAEFRGLERGILHNLHL